MRGTPVTRKVARSVAGITPAHAGNTTGDTITSGTIQDHPRTCGEHLIIFIRQITVWGSPPHMRGTLLAKPLEARVRRITPAHAGNTFYEKDKRTGA